MKKKVGTLHEGGSGQLPQIYAVRISLEESLFDRNARFA